MAITTVDESSVFTPETIIRALRQVYPPNEISEVQADIPGVQRIDVNSDSEPWFRVTWRDGSSVDLADTARIVPKDRILNVLN